MKIGMKEEIGVANKMTSSVWDREHALRATASAASFASTVTLLEAIESNDNRHEGGDWRYYVRSVHSELSKHCYLARSVGAR